MQLQKTTMQYSVTTASYGCILNAMKLIYKKFLQKSSFAWYCIKCFEDIIHKIKFKVLTKKNILTYHGLIDKLNNAMDDPESEMLSSKNYEPNEMAALFKGYLCYRTIFCCKVAFNV